MTQPFSSSDILRIYETGRARHALDRALLLVHVADPQLSEQELFELPIGARDARLFDARIGTLGDRFDAVASCPRCAALLELSFSGRDIIGAASPQPGATQKRDDTVALSCGLTIRLRCPNSRDLAAIAGAADVEAARHALIARCAEPIRAAGEQGALERLLACSEEISVLLTEQDPQADVELAIGCHACGHTWSAIFDIASFFWSEIEMLARRLVQEVALLARAFGWSEADILAKSPARRGLYLDLAV
ncbi:hypothetical protein ACVWYQ_006391 [Bradyrhizobium sp. USDA 3397]